MKSLRVLALMSCLALVMAAEDPYVAWWRRVHVDMAWLASGGDTQTALSSRRADPPPGAAGAFADAHQRLLLAWLAAPDAGARARAGGHLARICAEELPVVRALAADAPDNAPPDAGDATTAVFYGAAFTGMDPTIALVAGGIDGKRDLDADIPIDTAIRSIQLEEAMWAQHPAEAKLASGLDAPPTFPPEAERECLQAASAVLLDDKQRPFTAAMRVGGLVLRYRVASTCPPCYHPLAAWLADGAGWLGSTVERADTALARMRLATATMSAHPDLARLIMPAITAWGEHRRHERRIGWTVEAAASAEILRFHVEHPAEAVQADAAFFDATSAWRATVSDPAPAPGVPAAPADTAPDTHVFGPRADAVADAQLWAKAIAGLGTWAAGNAMLHDDLAAADAATAHQRGEALEAASKQIPEGGSTPITSACFEALTGWVAHAQAAVQAQEHYAALVAAGEYHIDAAVAARNDAVAGVVAARREVATAEARLARLLTDLGGAGTAFPSPPPQLGLGEAPVLPPGWQDPHLGEDQTLERSIANAGPAWRSAAARLISLRGGGASHDELIRAWRRYLRRHASYAAMAVGRHPDLDAMAGDLAHDHALISLALLTDARAGSQLPAPVDQAVQAWLANATTPLTGQVVAAIALDQDLHLELLLHRCSRVGECWAILAQRLSECPSRAEAKAMYAHFAILTGLAPGDAAQAKALDQTADWLLQMQHTVASALARATAGRVQDRDGHARATWMAAVDAWMSSPEAKAKP